MKLEDLPYLGTKRLNALAHSNIKSMMQLLHFFPLQYIDRTKITPIGSLKPRENEEATVVGTIKYIRTQGHGRKKRLSVVIEDRSGSLQGVWFKGVSYMKKKFDEDNLVSFSGKPSRYGTSISMAHPEVHTLKDADEVDDVTGIVPVYPSNKYFSNTHITGKLIRQWMQIALKHTKVVEFLPEALLKTYGFPNRMDAFRMMHAPESTKDHQIALQRFKFEELFLFQLSMARIKKTIREPNESPPFSKVDRYTSTFFNKHLPFELTGAQKRALADIKADVRSGRQMNRLLQGDVGSGKTVVALGAILMALDNGCQAAFMAPTEILAEQHFRTLQDFLAPLDINIRLLVGNQKSTLRTDILTSLQGGECQIVVGTHAIIQENVRFKNLGLAVIDEQHRFGVQQRAEILQKGTHPHVLVMSATPIPRSLAMTIYSDLDISVMDELPGGRKPVKTAIRSTKKLQSVYQFVNDTLRNGGQAYVVYPLVEESEKVDLKDATAGYEKLKSQFPNYNIGLLHGRMKAEEKDDVMQKFIEHNIQILVTTTVIEVGVDVANANIMIIQHAERFGLSQLHQLRGRIGRGERQSYCILVPGQKVSKDARFRLKKMVETTDGFKIAEADLKLRGPGDFLGTKQSGLPEFNVADIVEDRALLKKAKTEAEALMSEDHNLEKPHHQTLKKVFGPYFKKRAKFYGMG